MTNYNDGKWHGWNGGSCPVHHKTVVEGFCATTHSWGSACAAIHVPWNGINGVVAFRVVKEYKEPREFWVNEYPSGTVCTHTSKENANSNKLSDCVRTIHVREVVEDV